MKIKRIKDHHLTVDSNKLMIKDDGPDFAPLRQAYILAEKDDDNYDKALDLTKYCDHCKYLPHKDKTPFKLIQRCWRPGLFPAEFGSCTDNCIVCRGDQVIEHSGRWVVNEVLKFLEWDFNSPIEWCQETEPCVLVQIHGNGMYDHLAIIWNGSELEEYVYLPPSFDISHHIIIAEEINMN